MSYSSLGGAAGIAVGPDGNLWVAASTSNIYRVTPSGSVTAFPLPLGVVDQGSIAEGPDGNLWFTAAHANLAGTAMIGRISPAGAVTMFTVPDAASLESGLAGIVAGADGNPWFTEDSTDEISRITPAGTVTRFSLGDSPLHLPTLGMIAAVGDQLYFAEVQGGGVNAGCPMNMPSSVFPNGEPGPYWTAPAGYPAASAIVGSGGNVCAGLGGHIFRFPEERILPQAVPMRIACNSAVAQPIRQASGRLPVGRRAPDGGALLPPPPVPVDSGGRSRGGRVPRRTRWRGSRPHVHTTQVFSTRRQRT